MSDTYLCAMCREEFTKGWSDEESFAELKENFGGVRPEECDLVCDDCYQKINPAYHPAEVETAVAQTIAARLSVVPAKEG